MKQEGRAFMKQNQQKDCTKEGAGDLGNEIYMVIKQK